MNEDGHTDATRMTEGAPLAERVARTLLGPAPLGLFGLDAQLRITFVNASAAAFVAATVDQVLGRSSLDLVHPDDVGVIAESLGHVAGGRATLSTLFRICCLDGTVRRVEGSVQAYNPDDAELAFVVAVRDPVMSLSVDEFVLATLRSDLGEGMRSLVRLIEAEGDFGGSIHWGAAGSGFDTTVTLDPSIHALATHPAVVAMLRTVPSDAPMSCTLRSLGVDPGASDRRSFYAQHVGDRSATGLLVGWLPYETQLGAAGRNQFARVARLAALAFARHTDDERLRLAAMTDPLTGLANRAALRSRLEQSERGATLLLLDLDGFKTINDEHGHPVGDELLVAVAERLRSTAPDAALVARLGGDEFAVLLDRDLAIDHDALQRELDATLREPVTTSVGALSIGVSIGRAGADEHVANGDLFAVADRAMYERKRANPLRHAPRAAQPV